MDKETHCWVLVVVGSFSRAWTQEGVSVRQIPSHLGTKHETVPTAKERVTLGPGSCLVEPESLADS